MTEPVRDVESQVESQRCLNLLSKGLYINAGLPKGEEATGDGYFWCGRTQTMFGPDQGVCDAQQCVDVKRTCYEA